MMQRRDFLKASLFYTVYAAGTPLLTACASRKESPRLHAFPQGVASGDPRHESIVFWTRCVRVGAPEVPVELTLQVSTSRSFSSPVASVPLVATPRFDFTVRAKVMRLKPATRYYYRFLAGDEPSPVGTARTAPALEAEVKRLRFGWMTCQDWSTRHWGALPMMAQEDFEFVVHLGDYIYEAVPPPRPGRVEAAHPPIQLPDGETLADGTRVAVSLADYRTLYRTYRGDPRLQALHAAVAFIPIWDDHEFSDDGWQDHETYTNGNPRRTARRRAANQAWAEYMPVDFGDVSFNPEGGNYDNVRIYRDFHFGRLLHLVMTDERLYRDDHVVPEAVVARQQNHDPVDGSDPVGSRNFVRLNSLRDLEAAATARLGQPPSILGAGQTRWWKQTLAGSYATWKVWGNGVVMNRLWLDLSRLAPPPYNDRYVVDADAWDGYPSHKADLLGWLKEKRIRNVVALSGDLHAFQCGVVREHPEGGTAVLVDFVAAGISSTSFYEGIKAEIARTPLAAAAEEHLPNAKAFDKFFRSQNPDLLYADHDAQGFGAVTLTPERMDVVFTKVKGLLPDGRTPLVPFLKRTRIVLKEGSTTPDVHD